MRAGQNGFRARVAFQGLTILTVMWYAYDRTQKPKERVQVIREIDWAKLEQESKEMEALKKENKAESTIFASESNQKPV